MAITLVQNATGIQGGNTSITATFGSTPTQNNLMVAVLFTKSDTSPTDPTGWSTAVEVVNGTNVDYLRISYKVAGASESTAVTYTGMAGDNGDLGIFEFSGTATASPLDKTASTGITTGVTSLSSGTTAATTQADEVSIVGYGIRAACTSPSLTNSFTQQHTVSDTFGTTTTLFDGYHVETATGTKESTASWTTSGDAMGIIATFKAASSGPTVDQELPSFSQLAHSAMIGRRYV